MSGKYTMALNRAKQELEVSVEGNFTESQAVQFINDYNKHVSSINPESHVLRVDSRNLKVVTPQLVPALEQCFELYKSSGFKNIIIEIKENATLKMQVGRIARKIGLNYTIESN